MGNDGGEVDGRGLVVAGGEGQVEARDGLGIVGEIEGRAWGSVHVFPPVAVDVHRRLSRGRDDHNDIQVFVLRPQDRSPKVSVCL